MSKKKKRRITELSNDIARLIERRDNEDEEQRVKTDLTGRSLSLSSTASSNQARLEKPVFKNLLEKFRKPLLWASTDVSVLVEITKTPKKTNDKHYVISLDEYPDSKSRLFFVSEEPQNLSGRRTQSNTKVERFALVIGNSKYKQSALPGCKTDADEMQSKLEDNRYTVTKYLDLTGTELDTALRDFSFQICTISDKSIVKALVYFSGHGATAKPEQGQLMVGVDGKLAPLQVIIKDFSNATNRKNTDDQLGIILDCCRTVQEKGRGLGGKLQSLNPLGNCFIMYPCAPGTTAGAGNGDNLSVFTAAILPNLKLDVDVISISRKTTAAVKRGKSKQIPWYAESLKDSELDPDTYQKFTL